MAGLKDIKSEEQRVVIELGGKNRTLQYDMNAFGVLETKFGSVEKAMEGLSNGSIGNVKYLLWAGIIHEEVTAFDEETGEPLGYNVTPYQVGAMIGSPAALTSLVSSMTQALVASLPQEAMEGKQLPGSPSQAPKRTRKNPPAATLKKP